MQNFNSPITHSLAKNGLHCLLFSSEQARDDYSYALTKQDFEPQIISVPQKITPPPPKQQAKKIAPTNLTENTLAKVKKNPSLPLAKWPNNWLDMHKKFNLPKAENHNSKLQIVWIYEGLEQDVMGESNIQRKNIVRQLLKDLNHQNGTHVFVPYAYPIEADTSKLATEIINNEEISFFWSAMALVRPRILLIFGSVARNAINAPKSMPLQKSQMGNLQVLQMHKLETLAEDQNIYNNTLTFLQTYLHFCKKK